MPAVPHDRTSPHLTAIPTWLRGVTALAVARLGRDGTLLDANRGFRALVADGMAERGDYRDIFVSPRFDDLADRHATGDDAAVYSGTLSLAGAGSDATSLIATVYDLGEDLLVVAEHDVTAMARAIDRLKVLNAQMAQPRQPDRQPRRPRVDGQLTQRELDVLERLMTGLSNKEVAADLNISPRTVEVHRANIMSKMRAKNVIHLLRQILTGSD